MNNTGFTSLSLCAGVLASYASGIQTLAQLPPLGPSRPDAY